MAVKRIPISAKRYAKAAFELSQASHSVAELHNNTSELAAMIEASDDLMRMIASPRVGRAASVAVIEAIAKKAKFSDVFTQTLRLMAGKGRKYLIPAFLGALEDLFAQGADQVQAQVTSAHALTAAQTNALKKSLQSMSGKTVDIETRVDDGLLGGVIIRVGSTLIDDSVAGKLDRLKRKLVA